MLLSALVHLDGVLRLQLLDEELRLTKDDAKHRDDEEVALGLVIVDPQVQLRLLLLHGDFFLVLLTDAHLLLALDDFIQLDGPLACELVLNSLHDRCQIGLIELHLCRMREAACVGND